MQEYQREKIKEIKAKMMDAKIATDKLGLFCDSYMKNNTGETRDDLLVLSRSLLYIGMQIDELINDSFEEL